jgi:hypothetical protein
MEQLEDSTVLERRLTLKAAEKAAKRDPEPSICLTETSRLVNLVLPVAG